MAEQLFNIILVGDAFVALFVLVSIIQSAQKNVKAGCFSNLLVFGAIAAFLAAFLIRAINGITLTQQDTLALLGGIGVLVVFGIVFLIWDGRREGYQSIYSRGLLSIISGILLAGSFLFVPLIPEYIVQIPTATPITDAVRESIAQANIVPTEAVLPTGTQRPEATPTLTRTPLPTPTNTPTRRVYIPPTITPTLVNLPVENDCGATLTTNLNMRASDSTTADIVGIIPEGRYINILGKNADETWYFTEFEGEQGWIAGDYLRLDDVCFVER